MQLPGGIILRLVRSIPTAAVVLFGALVLAGLGYESAHQNRSFITVRDNSSTHAMQTQSSSAGHVAGDATVDGQGSGSSNAGSGQTSQDSGATSPHTNTGGSPVLTARMVQLVASPSQVNLSYASSSQRVAIYADNGADLPPPTVSAPGGVGMTALLDESIPPPHSGLWLQKTWYINVSQWDPNSSGSSYVTVSAYGWTTKFLVTWQQKPSFSMIKGPLVRTEDASTITYTAHFTLVPNNPYFGSPTITMQIVGTSACINTAELSRIVQYNGQNEYSLSCVVSRMPVYVPGSGPPPPIASSLSFELEVYGRLSTGEFVNSPAPIWYTTQAPYNQ